MKKKTTIKRLSLCFLAVMVLLVGGLGSVQSAKAAPTGFTDDQVASSGTVTGYFCEMKMKDRQAFVNKKHLEYMHKENGFKQMGWGGTARTMHYMTLIVQFPDIKNKGLPIILMYNVYINHTDYTGVTSGLNSDVYIQDDFNVYLHVSFYNLMQLNKSNLSTIKLMVYWNNSGYPLLSSKYGSEVFTGIEARLYTKDLPVSVNDPTSDDFMLGGNGGADASKDSSNTQEGQEETNKKSFWSFLADLFDTTPEQVKNVFKYGLVTIVVIVCVGLLLFVLRWLKLI